jgi:hypothetical protein
VQIGHPAGDPMREFRKQFQCVAGKVRFRVEPEILLQIQCVGGEFPCSGPNREFFRGEQGIHSPDQGNRSDWRVHNGLDGAHAEP